MLSTQNTGAPPGAQEKKRQPPLSLQIRQNVRIEDRVDLTLGPSDPKYQETEKYFAALLEDKDWTIARIKEEHFSLHEAKKFSPTTESPWAQWQADDTRAFAKLLQTRFKGVKPTLSMKMALLYHGFAVAPLKIGPVQDVTPQDYHHFARRENKIIQDPLEFLEGYNERTWGETPPDPAPQPRRVPFVTEAMGLRGGALDDDEMEGIMSEDEHHADTGHAGFVRSNARRVAPTSLFSQPHRASYADSRKANAKKAAAYNRQAEFRTGSGTHESMRKQAWWTPPSIFANPLKPIMPLHAAPLETVIKTGPSVPSVSLGLRTSTEMARLEREVHMLRGHLLDRNRECPYHDCHRFFHYLDTEGFEKHLTQEHAIVRCTLCLAFSTTEKHLGTLYLDRKHILEHIAGEHSEHLAEFVSVPTSHHAVPSQQPTSTGVTDRRRIPANVRARLGRPFCDRCGRDNNKCSEGEDILNHMYRCTLPDWSFASESPPAYCESCGTKTGSSWPERSCPDRNCASNDPNLADEERFCHKCGLHWSDNHSEAYKATHGAGCKLMGGPNDSFCMDCGISLRGLCANGLQNHGQVCAGRKQPTYRETAEENLYAHLYEDGYYEEPIRDSIENGPPLDQESHFEPEPIRDDTETWVPLNLEAQFQPEPDAHCSRCFLQYKDCEKPDLHANMDLSCNIYWGKGVPGNLPNVTGWVSRRELEAGGRNADDVLRRSAQTFVSQWPDYAPTISKAYLPQTSAATASGAFLDPNVAMLMSQLNWRYPWPPSNKRLAAPPSHTRSPKKQRRLVGESDRELSADGGEVLTTDAQGDGQGRTTQSPPPQLFLPQHRNVPAPPQGTVFGTPAGKQEKTIGTAAPPRTPSPPASRQSSVSAATMVTPPATTRRSATPATRPTAVGRQKSATPAATAVAVAVGAPPKATGAMYPWPGPKVAGLEKAAGTVGAPPVEVTVGATSSGWGGSPEAPSAATAVTPPTTPAKATTTTRSGRKVRKTRAAADASGGRDEDVFDGPKKTPVVTGKRGRPKK